MRPETYEIRLKGRLPAGEAEEFVGMEVTEVGDGTLLCGIVSDQPALIGMVVRAESLGCSVVEVRAVPAGERRKPDARRKADARRKTDPDRDAENYAR